MKLTVLGCSGPYPAANGACSGYLVSAGRRNILLDCGAGVLGRLFALMDPAELDGIVLSHLHADHCADMLVLRYYLERVGKTLPVYLPVTESAMFSMLTSEVFKLHDIKLGISFDDMRIESLRVNHPVPAYAVRLSTAGKSMVYTGDTNLCDGLEAFCAGTDLLLADACFPEALWNENLPHMSAVHAAHLAAGSHAARLVLTHFSPAFDIDSLVREAENVFRPVEAAHLSLRISL
jgi:ribonuclease BN (tRNA processing enzyme)